MGFQTKALQFDTIFIPAICIDKDVISLQLKFWSDGVCLGISAALVIESSLLACMFDNCILFYTAFILQGPFYQHGLPLIEEWISNHMSSKI